MTKATTFVAETNLPTLTQPFYIMRNITNINNEDTNEPFAVAQHIILRNGWEYYLEQEDENGIAFGYVMGFENEWGSVDLNELKPYIASRVQGDELNHIMAPFGYIWEDEAELHERAQQTQTD